MVSNINLKPDRFVRRATFGLRDLFFCVSCCVSCACIAREGAKKKRWRHTWPAESLILVFSVYLHLAAGICEGTTAKLKPLKSHSVYIPFIFMST